MGNQPSGGAGGGGHHGGDVAATGSSSYQPHSTMSPHQQQQVSQSLRNLLRTSTGSLGLSKVELDRRCQPSGLYPSCQWDDKAIRRLVGDGKLAARLKGTEESSIAAHAPGARTSAPTSLECPICFLWYTEVNTTKCCQAYICSECFLQVKPPPAYSSKSSKKKDKDSSSSGSCPFCCATRLQVTVAKPDATTQQELMEREQEEQMAIEAKIRARTNDNSQTDDFGSSLQLHTARLKEAPAAPTDPSTPKQQSSPLAMTPEERSRIEEEMKAQRYHPLAQRVEQEEQERAMRNERAYYRSQTARLRELRARRDLLTRTLGTSSARGDPLLSFAPTSSSSSSSPSQSRDWNRLVQAFENSGSSGRPVHSLDDLVVLEAAILLSMEEERRRAAGEEGGEAAGADSATGEASTATTNETSNAAESDFATRQAGSGFPLARDRVHQLLAASAAAASNNSSMPPTFSLAAAHTQASRTSRNRARAAAAAAGRGALLVGPPSDGITLDTAAMLMRGISEEEQIAMAIAASLEESRRQEEQPGEAAANDGQGETAAAAPAAGHAGAAPTTETAGAGAAESLTAPPVAASLKQGDAGESSPVPAPIGDASTIDPLTSPLQTDLPQLESNLKTAPAAAATFGDHHLIVAPSGPAVASTAEDSVQQPPPPLLEGNLKDPPPPPIATEAAEEIVAVVSDGGSAHI